MKFIVRDGVEDAPYPEVNAVQFKSGVDEIAGVKIEKRGAKGEEFWAFKGNRSGAHGTEILAEGDYIVKVSASIFAMQRKTFENTYKRAVPLKKVNKLSRAGGNGRAGK